MKKLFTLLLSLVAFSVVSVNAQTWDFTGGLSDATKANLNADATNWASNRTNAETKEVTGWKNAKALSDGTVLTANGQTISEFEGIIFNKCAAGNILLDPTSFRLGGKSETITFKGIKKGQTITIKAKSANSTAENRALITTNTEGVTYVSGPTDGICYGAGATSATAIAELANAEGGVFTLVWSVDTENEDGIDVTIGTGSASGGIDIQMIKISGGNADADKNVAWISTDPSADMNKAFAPTTGVQYTDITADTNMSTEELRAYDVVIVSTDVTADSPMGKLVEENIAFQPIINLNTNLFGYTPANVSDTKLTVSNKDDEIFEGVDIDENNQFDYVNIGVSLPERFANDDILAKCGDAVAIHQHNAKRNTYILLASDAESAAAQTNAWQTMMQNAISIAANTKKAITKVSKPVISQKNEEGITTVSISCATTGSKIKYAIDGDPFQDYTEPFTVTAECTVYAYATAEGYNPMSEDEAVDQAIKVYTKAAAPYISSTQDNGTATITISAEEGATIYYNFTGSSLTTESAVYTEPVQIVENATVTAFVVKEGYLNSDVTSLDITGLIAMGETLSHFDANKTDWSNGESKTYYYCYLRGNSEKKYSVSENYTCKYAPENNDWALYTSGQQVVWESTSPQKNIGDVSNYNPVRAIDNIAAGEITGGEITFGTTSSSTVYAEDATTPLTNAAGTDSIAQDKPNAELVSNVQFQAPFSIITYVGSKPGKQGFDYMVSTDGENWTTIGTSPEAPTYTDAASKWRLWHRDVLKYNGTDKVYLKLKSISTDSYRIFDVFVKESTGETTAIQNVATSDTETTATRKYTHNGQILIKTARGTFNAVGARVK